MSRAAGMGITTMGIAMSVATMGSLTMGSMGVVAMGITMSIAVVIAMGGRGRSRRTIGDGGRMTVSDFGAGKL